MQQLDKNSADLIRMAMGDDVQCTTIERADGHVVAIAHIGDIPKTMLANITECVISDDYMVTTLLPFVLDAIPDSVWSVTDKKQLSSSLASKAITCFESGVGVDFKKEIRELLGKDIAVVDVVITPNKVANQLVIVDTGAYTPKELLEITTLFSSGLKSDRIKAEVLLDKPTEVIWDWVVHGTMNYIALINRAKVLASFRDPRRELEGVFELSVTTLPTDVGTSTRYEHDNLEFKLLSGGVPKKFAHQINANAVWIFRHYADRFVDAYVKHRNIEVNNEQPTKLVISCTSTDLFKTLNIVVKDS